MRWLLAVGSILSFVSSLYSIEYRFSSLKVYFGSGKSLKKYRDISYINAEVYSGLALPKVFGGAEVVFEADRYFLKKGNPYFAGFGLSYLRSGSGSKVVLNTTIEGSAKLMLTPYMFWGVIFNKGSDFSMSVSIGSSLYLYFSKRDARYMYIRQGSSITTNMVASSKDYAFIRDESYVLPNFMLKVDLLKRYYFKLRVGREYFDIENSRINIEAGIKIGRISLGICIENEGSGISFPVMFKIDNISIGMRSGILTSPSGNSNMEGLSFEDKVYVMLMLSITR